MDFVALTAVEEASVDAFRFVGERACSFVAANGVRHNEQEGQKKRSSRKLGIVLPPTQLALSGILNCRPLR